MEPEELSFVEVALQKGYLQRSAMPIIAAYRREENVSLIEYLERKHLLSRIQAQEIQGFVHSCREGMERRVSSNAKLNSGDRFAHYRIDRIVGQGGMGTVYKALDEKMGRTVALKVIHDSGDEMEKRLHRVIQEAKSLAQLKHPYIVTIFDGNFSGWKVSSRCPSSLP